MRYSASKNSVTLKTVLRVIQGHWKRRRSIDHFLLVRHCNYSSILYRFWVIWRWIISHPSFRKVPCILLHFYCTLNTNYRIVSIRYDTIRSDSVYLTCSKKLTGNQLSPSHGTNKKLKCETKNKTMGMIDPVQSRCYIGSPVGKRSLRWEGFVEKVRFEPGVKEWRSEMGDESGDDNRDELISEWGGESRHDWRSWRNESGSWFQRRDDAYLNEQSVICVSYRTLTLINVNKTAVYTQVNGEWHI